MPHRVFIALPLPDTIEEPAHKWQQDHRKLLVRWIAPKNLHITIIPPWEENDTAPIIEILKTIEGTVGPIPLALHRVAFGPTNANPASFGQKVSRRIRYLP